jgi:hypothetical protein
MAEVGDAFNGTVGWFGSLSRGAKLRLLLITLVIAWLVCIAAPVLVISTLAADNVTNLQGAIAFVQTATPIPTEAPLPTATPEPQAAMISASSEENGAERAGEAVQPAEAASVEAAVLPPEEAPIEASAEEVAAPAEMAVAEAPVAPQDTPTPWIIVITNTPLPPTATPLPTDTPVPPTATPRPTPKRVTSAAAPIGPTPTPAGKPQPPRDLDPRLGSLNVSVQPAGVRPGQSYWRLIAARWENEAQSGGGHSIFVDLLDEGGAKIIGHPVEIRWAGGGLTVSTEPKPPNEPSSNFPMYNTLGSYAVSIPGLPSDVIVGLGLGTAEQPAFTIHTNFFLTFKRVTR